MQVCALEVHAHPHPMPLHETVGGWWVSCEEVGE